MPRGMWALLLATGLWADDKLLQLRSGPFEFITDGSEKTAKVRLSEMEQFRYVFGRLVARDDWKPLWRFRVVALKKPARVRLPERVRDTWFSVMPLEEPLSPEWRRRAAQIFLDDNTKRYATETESGLLLMIAYLNVAGLRVTLGAPPPSKRNLDWARLHLLATDDRYAGKMRVYFSNLENGADPAVATRNAFEISLAQLETEAQQHLGKGTYAERPLANRPFNTDRDVGVKTLVGPEAQLARADVSGVYAGLTGPEADESRGDFAAAVAAGTKSAQAWYEHALKLSDSAAAQAALQKAAELNPAWGGPVAEQARREKIPGKQLAMWKHAASLEPRNVAYWRNWAELAVRHNQFADAAKAWAGAERAAPTTEERQRLIQARRDLETQRADFAEQERRRASEERLRETERLKAEALSSIREAEAKANRRLNEGKEPAPAKPVEWWDGPGGPQQMVEAHLERVECLGQ
jgi:hypothetical protein